MSVFKNADWVFDKHWVNNAEWLHSGIAWEGLRAADAEHKFYYGINLTDKGIEYWNDDIGSLDPTIE